MKSIELHLRRYKHLYGFISVLIAVAGLSLSLYSLHLKQQEASSEVYKFLLHEKDSDITTVRVVNEYAGTLPGYVIPIDSPDTTPPQVGGKLQPSFNDPNLFLEGTPMELRQHYSTNYLKFKLNDSAVASTTAILEHLLRVAPENSEDKIQKETSRIRYAEQIIAPQIAAKSRSFDPTERAASLVLASNIVHPKDDGAVVKFDSKELTRSFKGAFLGHIRYPHLDLSGFDLSGVDFFNTKFGDLANFSRARLTNARFERSSFNGSALFNNAMLNGTDFSNTSFESVEFENISPNQSVNGKTIFVGSSFESATFNNCSFPNADFSNSSATNLKVIATEKKCDFRKAKFLDFNVTSNGGANFQNVILNGVHFDGNNTSLENSIFENCVLDNTSFLGIDVSKAVLNQCSSNRILLGGAPKKISGGTYRGGSFLAHILDPGKIVDADIDHCYISEEIGRYVDGDAVTGCFRKPTSDETNIEKLPHLVCLKKDPSGFQLKGILMWNFHNWKHVKDADEVLAFFNNPYHQQMLGLSIESDTEVHTFPEIEAILGSLTPPIVWGLAAPQGG